MAFWQQIIVLSYGALALLGLFKAIDECKNKKRSYSHPWPVLGLMGSFVWADHVVFGAFWTIASLAALTLHDWILFWLIISLFWLIRAAGETQYWLHQQFTPKKGNQPEKFWSYKIRPGDAVWFTNQTYWQCITVVTIITSIYLAKLWLS